MALGGRFRILAGVRATATAREGAASSPSPLGRLLQEWRKARRMSQLALAVEAEVSARHLSFVETGRAQPSRDIVLRLADVLNVPLRERNALLLAAGYAPLYRETGLAAPEMGQVRKALDFMLKQQEPYPAIVMDRHWNILRINAGATRMLSQFLGPSAMSQDRPRNAMRLIFDPRGLRPFIANWEALARALIERVHREALGGVPDSRTARLLEELLAYPGVPRGWGAPNLEAKPVPLLVVELQKAELSLQLFSTLTTLGTPQDITLQELRMECFFPADGATEQALRGLEAAAALPT
jgi:transcriptional regulator with XRE-family HTH domain